MWRHCATVFPLMPQTPQDSTVSFVLVDVFTDRPLHGNPVAVVPDAERLAEDVMHRIAREFNQSETVFLLPPTRPGADWRLRAFTAAGSEAFGAGHHTLGAWWWLAESGALTLGESGGRFTQEVGDRLLAVAVACAAGRVTSIGQSQTEPVFGAVCSDLAELAAALALSADDLATATLPAQVVSTGAGHLLVPLRSRAAVDRARPDMPRLASVLRAVDGEGCYLFTRETVRPDAAAHARFFNPTLGIVEDIATGTAAGPLACLLVAHHLADDGSTLRIEQGDAMGRPSVIQVHVAGPAVTVSGQCVVVGDGRLRVPEPVAAP
jgi:trans-2,3-dihydro-3-hydroxyanthranilate isomerase